jgi:hypothetical protein
MPKQKTKIKELSSESLKNALWATLNEVRTGNTNTQKANAISSTARTICSIVKLELQVQKLLGQKPKGKTTKFIGN